MSSKDEAEEVVFFQHEGEWSGSDPLFRYAET